MEDSRPVTSGSPVPALPERYQWIETLWQSATESLHRARDRVLDREVVIKVQLGAADAQVTREAKMLGRVRHPGVLVLHDVLPVPGGMAMVMEPVAGEPLADRLARQGPLAPDEVRALGRQLCAALAAVHAEGIVHRGLSAANVILRPDGTPCLTGFVFAKPSAGGGQSSIDYRRCGELAPSSTALPRYPAPEQVAGYGADARADVYGLGCVLYEALTGQPAPGPAHDPRQVRRDVPRDLAAAVVRATARSPLGRFPTAQAMQEALPVAPAGPAATSLRWPFVAGVGVVLVACLVYLVWRGGAGDSEDAARGGPARRPRADAVAYAPRYTASRALVVGIGKPYPSIGYGFLPNAEADAAAIGDTLQEMGWTVERLLGAEATRKRIIGALAKLEEAEPDAQVLVYFAGHAEAHEHNEWKGFLVPADGADRDGKIAFSTLHDFFGQTRAKHVLLVLDCCHAGILTAPPQRDLKGEAFRDTLLTKRSHSILVSCLAAEKASDGRRGAHSPFATAFLAALRRPGRNAVLAASLAIEIQEAFCNDPELVSQVPQFQTMRDERDAGGGQFVFLRR